MRAFDPLRTLAGRETVDSMIVPTIMVRLIAGIAPVLLLLAPAGLHACMPPMANFAFGSARLDADGRAQVAYASDEFRQAGPSARVRVIAQTDGSNANLRMSRLRAQAVRAELARRGVPARAIMIETRDAAALLIRGENYARIVVMVIDSAPLRGAAAGTASCS